MLRDLIPSTRQAFHHLRHPLVPVQMSVSKTWSSDELWRRPKIITTYTASRSSLLISLRFQDLTIPRHRQFQIGMIASRFDDWPVEASQAHPCDESFYIQPYLLTIILYPSCTDITTLFPLCSSVLRNLTNLTKSSVRLILTSSSPRQPSPPARTFPFSRFPSYVSAGSRHSLHRRYIMETYTGHVRTPADAIILFEACRLGLLPRVQRRLSEKERQSIKSGSVFVWDEREAGMRRWTDGKSWSASRVSGSFLTYREMEGKRGGSGFAPSLAASRAGKTPESTRGSDSDVEAPQEEGPDGYRYKPDGLMKQSFSITTSNGNHLHLISYYSRSSPNAQSLNNPTSDPSLRSIRPQKGMYPESTVHEQQNIPAVTRAPMASAGYSTIPHMAGIISILSVLNTPNIPSIIPKIHNHHSKHSSYITRSIHMVIRATTTLQFRDKIIHHHSRIIELRALATAFPSILEIILHTARKRHHNMFSNKLYNPRTAHPPRRRQCPKLILGLWQESSVSTPTQANGQANGASSIPSIGSIMNEPNGTDGDVQGEGIDRSPSRSPGGTKSSEGPKDIPGHKMGFVEDKRALSALDRAFKT
ncbi:MAG: hypothetical protein L6R40_007963 [Gallowayella cf. fulva]|nr:MAG: hypothetical protein L6R40_007963 [Xanthomendoza cf. fulva]